MQSAAEADGCARATGRPIATKPRYQINSRGEALAYLESVAVYFRAAEPSSPIPFLIDRARDLAVRDFLSVLGALLPENTLKTIDPRADTSIDLPAFVIFNAGNLLVSNPFYFDILRPTSA